MSKIYEALQHVERERSAGQQDAQTQGLARAAAERDALHAEIRACQEQLAALTARVAAAPPDAAIRRDMDELRSYAEEQRQTLAAAVAQVREDTMRVTAAISEKLDTIAAQQQRNHERIDHATKDLAAAVQDLHLRTDDIGHENEQIRDRAQADVTSVRQQLAEALHDRDERVAQLAYGVRTAQSEEQLVLAELRQQMAAMEMLHTSSRTELRDLVESANDRAGDAGRRLDALTGGLQTHEALLGRIQTAQAELKNLVQRAEKRLRELASETVRGIDQHAERSEALRASLDSVSARLADAEGAAREAAQRWQQELDRLRATVAQSTAAAAAVNTSHIEDLTARLDAFHQHLAGADDAQRQLRQRLNEELADQRQALSAEALRVAQLSRDESQAGQQELVTRFEAAVAAQSDADTSVRALSAAVQTVVAAQQRSADDIDALRGQVTPVVDMQARLQACADGLAHAQTTADEALSRIGALDHLRATSLAALREQVTAMQADKSSLRDAVETSLVSQQRVTDEFKALRAQVMPLTQSQAQLRDLAEAVGHVRTTATDAARQAGMVDRALGASLGVLRQEIAALDAEKASLHDAVQTSTEAQQQSTAEIDVLRTQVARLAESQAQLQNLADGVSRAQATAEEAARRIAAIDGALAAVYKPTT